jgi:hypothetical protein
MTIDQDPLSTNARVIQAPKLKYNEVSRQPTIVSSFQLLRLYPVYNFIPYDRNRKMVHGICSFPTSLLICVILIFSQFRIDKKFYEPSTIVRWAIVIYESSRYFPEPAFKGMVDGFLKACDAVGQHLNVIYIFYRLIFSLAYRDKGGQSRPVI